MNSEEMCGLDVLGANEPRILKRGSKGEDVKLVQQTLAELGYDPGAADGIFGPATEKAVLAYQKACNMKKIDGMVGPETREALSRRLISSSTYSFDPNKEQASDFVGPPAPVRARPAPARQTARKAAGAAAAAKSCAANGGPDEWLNFVVVMLLVLAAMLVAPAVLRLARRATRAVAKKFAVVAAASPLALPKEGVR